jgi:hypothetical protein
MDAVIKDKIKNARAYNDDAQAVRLKRMEWSDLEQGVKNFLLDLIISGGWKPLELSMVTGIDNKFLSDMARRR